MSEEFDDLRLMELRQAQAWARMRGVPVHDDDDEESQDDLVAAYDEWCDMRRDMERFGE